MKNEKERMQEYLQEYTNAHGNLPKSTGIDKTINTINISLKTLMIIITIILGIMLFIIGIFVYRKTELVFSMNKEQFIRMIEKEYGKKIEIIEDNSTVKGNGTMLLKTKREPHITFHAYKNIYDDYQIDFEENAFIYYFENSKDPVFEQISIEKDKKALFSNYPEFEFVSCNICLNIDNYNDISTTCAKREALQNWMKKKINNFKLQIHLKIGDYTSNLSNYEKLEDIIYKEQYEYYWYLKNNQKSTSSIPKEDVAKMNKPKNLVIYVNGQKLIDEEQTQLNKINAELNKREDYEIAYAKANYNIDKKDYEISTKAILLSCKQFTILDKNTNTEFSFSYKGNTYGMHYKDDKIHGNKLPHMSKLSYFEELLGIDLKYDYENEKVEFKL